MLARHSKLSVFDEPEAGIDLWSFHNLIGVFQAMKESQSGTSVIISHQERILAIADEIVVIADGQITKQGPASEILPQLLAQESGCPQCMKKEIDFGGQSNE